MGNDKKLMEKLFAADKPFFGTRIDENKLKNYNRLIELAKEIGSKKYTFLDITTEYKTEIPNDRRNASVFVNVLTPANINIQSLKESFSEMINLADNFTMAFLEAGSEKQHKIIRLGFAVRDIWVDESEGS